MVPLNTSVPRGGAVVHTVVPVMNGHPRDQAKVSVHCRWPLIRGTDGHVEMSRGIDNVAVHSRWPLTTGVAQGRYFCSREPKIRVAELYRYFVSKRFINHSVIIKS